MSRAPKAKRGAKGKGAGAKKVQAQVQARGPSRVAPLVPFWIYPLALAAAVAAAYSNSFGGPFIFDDSHAITNNATIRHLWPLSDVLWPEHQNGGTGYRPVANLSFALNYAFSGLKVTGYHLFNLVVHFLVVLALFGVARRTLRRQGEFAAPGRAAWLAFAIALLWALHPLQTESVTYVMQRVEAMVSLFYLLTLYCFLRGAEGRAGLWYPLAVLACLLGMGTKEVMASAPLAVLMLDRTFVAGTFREAWRRRWGLYAALASTWVLLGFLAVSAEMQPGANGFHNGVTGWEYLLRQCQAIPHYLRLVIWPFPQVFDYGAGLVVDWLDAVPGGLFVLALLAATAVALRRWPRIGFLGFWFFAILGPSSSFFPVSQQPLAEHRLYLPLAALVVLLVLGLDRLGRKGWIAGLFLALAWGGCTWRRNQDYASEISIWQATAKACPENVRAPASLGQAFHNAGRDDEALAAYDDAIRLEPDYYHVYADKGVIFAQRQQLAEAEECFEHSLRLDANFPDAWSNLAIVLLQMGKPEKALPIAEQALRLDSDDVFSRTRMGLVLQALKRWPEAVVQFEEAVRIQPEFLDARDHLNYALLLAGRKEEALAGMREDVARAPQNPFVHDHVGYVLVAMGRPEEAIPEIRTAVRLAPAYIDFQKNLADALLQAGHPSEAAAQYEAVLRVAPSDAIAKAGLVRARQGKK